MICIGKLKRRGLPASELLQIALRAELERQDALDETATVSEELAASARSANPPPGNARMRTHHRRDAFVSEASARRADVLILDSGGVTRLSSRNKQALALIRSLVLEGLWPPIIVPTMVLVESFPVIRHEMPTRTGS